LPSCLLRLSKVYFLALLPRIRSSLVRPFTGNQDGRRKGNHIPHHNMNSWSWRTNSLKAHHGTLRASASWLHYGQWQEPPAANRSNLTTVGCRIDTPQATVRVGGNLQGPHLLQDINLLEIISHLTHERIPERQVNPSTRPNEPSPKMNGR
jgi:hypothetical protein